MVMDERITLREYLRRLPTPPPINAGRIHSSTSTTTPRRPKTDLVKLEDWDDYKSPEEVLKEVLDTVSLSSPLTHDVRAPPRANNEAAIRTQSMLYVEEYINVILRQMSIDAELSDIDGYPTVIGDPDRALLSAENTAARPVLVSEFKTPWAAPMANVLAEFNGVGAREQTSRNKRRRTGSTVEDKSKNALQQIYGYMTLNHCQYGILTNYDLTYFLKRKGRDQPRTLQIYGPILRDNGSHNPMESIHAHYLALIFLLQKDISWLHASQPTRAVSPLQEHVLLDGCKDQTMIFERGVARGNSVVWRGTYKNSRVVFKMTTHFRSNLDHEEIVYERLKALQGTVIPRLIASGNVWDMLRVLVLEDVGDSLNHVLDSDEEEIDEETEEQILYGLSKIHELGVLHGDLRLCNVARDREGALRIIDFDVAKLDPDEEEKQDELELRLL